MKTEYKKGDVLIYQSRRGGYSCLTVGKEYVALSDEWREIETPLFNSDPVVRVVADNGKHAVAHASRFKKKVS